jgi:signal transduction histidine kinase
MRARLLLTYLTLTVFVLAVLELPLAVTYAHDARQSLTARVERDAVAIASVASPSPADRRATLRPVALAYRARTGGRVLIVDRRGRPLVDSGPALADDGFGSRPEIARALQGLVASGVRRSRSLGRDLLYVAVPVGSQGVVRGAVRITYPTSAVESRIHRYWLVLAAIAGIVLAVALALGAGLATSFSRPLRQLRTAAARAGGGDLSTRAPTAEGPPEVRAVAGAFNDMVERVEELLRAQDDLVADASHQLRSPLAALRLRLENLRHGAPSDMTDGLDAALDEAARLGRIVDGLLALARADAAGAAPAAVDAAAVVAGRIAAWTPAAAAQGVELRSAAAADVVALATPGHLEQVLDNLVANALTASPPGAGITVTARRLAATVEVRVRDEGRGLASSALERAFDRFWTAGSGTGLGLAVVRRLVEADGGSVLLRHAPGGVEAVVRLPERSGGRREDDARDRAAGSAGLEVEPRLVPLADRPGDREPQTAARDAG